MCLAAGATIRAAYIPSGDTAVSESSATEVRGRAEDAYEALTGTTTTEPVESRVADVEESLARIARMPTDDLPEWPDYRYALTRAVIALQDACASVAGIPDILNPPAEGRTPEELKELLGTPCTSDGELLTPGRPEMGAGLGPVDAGVVCARGAWAALKEPLGRCLADQTDLPYATADQRPLFCVTGQVFLDGQPNPGPLLNGSYLIGEGTGMVPPGTYEVLDVQDCYWERLDRNGYVMANNFILNAPRAEFTVSPGDHALNIENCAGFTRIS